MGTVAVVEVVEEAEGESGARWTMSMSWLGGVLLGGKLLVFVLGVLVLVLVLVLSLCAGCSSNELAAESGGVKFVC